MKQNPRTSGRFKAFFLSPSCQVAVEQVESWAMLRRRGAGAFLFYHSLWGRRVLASSLDLFVLFCFLAGWNSPTSLGGWFSRDKARVLVLMPKDSCLLNNSTFLVCVCGTVLIMKLLNFCVCFFLCRFEHFWKMDNKSLQHLNKYQPAWKELESPGNAEATVAQRLHP